MRRHRQMFERARACAALESIIKKGLDIYLNQSQMRSHYLRVVKSAALKPII